MGGEGSRESAEPQGLQPQTDKQEEEKKVVLGGLPADLLGRIFSAVPDEERCAILPCVSREFLRVHKLHPPRRVKWTIERPITRPVLSFLLDIASDLEVLEVHFNECGSRHRVLQLLTVASVRAPKLRCIRISSCHEPLGVLLDSLCLSTQLECLRIDGCRLHAAASSFSELRNLDSLPLLKELRLRGVEGLLSCGGGFWQALVRLKHLQKLSVILTHPSGWIGGARADFFKDLSMLQDLRDLEMNPEDVDLETDEDGDGETTDLGRSFAALTRLTRLVIPTPLGYGSLQQMVGLPQLQCLGVCVRDLGVSAGLPLQSRQLTRLQVDGMFSEILNQQLPVNDLLPASTPALPHLRSLTLRKMGLTDFPEAVAAALQQLTYLDLSNNRFARLPRSVSLIAGLGELHLDRNPPLQLKMDGDVDALAALPRLHTFHFCKECWAGKDARLTTDSVRTLIALAERLPRLRLLHYS